MHHSTILRTRADCRVAQRRGQRDHIVGARDVLSGQGRSADSATSGTDARRLDWLDVTSLLPAVAR